MPLDFNALSEAKYPWVRGHVLRFTSGVVGVPTTYRDEGWWTVMVIGGDNPSYPAGGTDIQVSPQDIADAERITI